MRLLNKLKSKSKRLYVVFNLILLSFIIVLGFQNCSDRTLPDMNASNNLSASLEDEPDNLICRLFNNCTDPGGIVVIPEYPTGDGRQDPSGQSTPIPEPDGTIIPIEPGVFEQTNKVADFNQKTDILFVLDDSCPMGTIIENVRNGIDSLGAVEFAPDTKMAVTYMSPVKVYEDGTPNYTSPAVLRAKGTPGHIQLVSQRSMNAFLNMSSDLPEVIESKNKLVHEACSSEWFSPLDRNTQGKSCLQAAMQTPLLCTIYEAGVTSLDQLLQKKISENKTIFRENSDLHIIFVSDTHDSGGGSIASGEKSMYGKANLPKRIRTPEEVIERVMTNNPNLQSVRFNGIVRLPVEGDQKLDGVVTVGNIPQNYNESKISGEGFHDFKYLDYIKATNGVAMHATDNDWSLAMKALMSFTNTPTSTLVVLHKKAKSISWVMVNGEEVGKDRYSLKADQKTVEVNYPFQNSQSYNIVIRFED